MVPGWFPFTGFSYLNNFSRLFPFDIIPLHHGGMEIFASTTRNVMWSIPCSELTSVVKHGADAWVGMLLASSGRIFSTRKITTWEVKQKKNTNTHLYTPFVWYTTENEIGQIFAATYMHDSQYSP